MQLALRVTKDTAVAHNAVERSLSLLVDAEVRVRLAVGECLGEATKILGSQVWTQAKKPILDTIKRCWVRKKGKSVSRLFSPPELASIEVLQSHLCITPCLRAASKLNM